MAEYINKEELVKAAGEVGTIVCGYPGMVWREGRDAVLKLISDFPVADVVERKPLSEDVEELVKDLYAFSKDCTDSDMCRDCQFCFMCEDGWPPNAIAHLIETWSATHKAMTERKTGVWIGEGDGYADGNMVYDMWSCGCCGTRFDEWEDKPTWKYCPVCGSYNGGNYEGESF